MINEKNIRALELDKVLAILAKECPSDQCAKMAMELQPATTPERVKMLMRQTEDAHMLIGRFSVPGFGSMKDITGAVLRSKSGAALSLRELLDIAAVLQSIRTQSEWYNNIEGVSTCLDGKYSLLYPNKYLETAILSSILSDEEVSDNASPALSDIRRKIRRQSAKVREVLDNMIRSTAYQKYLQEPIVTIRSDRFVVPVKAEHRGDVPGLVHDTSSSGATVFIEPMSVVELNNGIRLLKAEEEQEIERILYSLSNEVSSFSDSILTGYNTLLELALIFAKARLGYSMRAVVPEIADDGVIDLKKARHPLIDSRSVVPIDITLGLDFDTLVITGPNTGGKTVTLKTLGLLTLMTMCGLMIPAGQFSKISVFDSILADIGDEQSIEQSLSTFSAHMTNIIKTIEVADDKSLVLLDELGAGTDPVEGAALAMAILEHLREKGCRIAATTHYAELKVYALQTAGVQNACCEFDVATLRPTYRLLIGVPGRSNAFAISERLGLDKDIVERAGLLISGENRRFEDVVQKLETSRQQMESQNEEAQRVLNEARRREQQLNEEMQKLRERSQRELERARQQAKQLLERTRMQSNAILNELEETRRQKDSADFGRLTREAKQKLRSGMDILEGIADPVEDRKPTAYVLPRPLKIGDTVLIVDLDKKATVTSLPDNQNMVGVIAGIIKTKVSLDNLRLITEKKDPDKYSKYARRQSLQMDKSLQTAQTKLDLRGKNTEEALNELDLFLDDAVLQGLETLTIVHGKGTGTLRTAVGQFLKKHKAVKSYRLGVYGEGETGVTIVELKK
ncbi:MAG: endonuclease MutS2 [Clostridia bacterium]|nr:endonuclease MutS2 [Clostridia bacterium]